MPSGAVIPDNAIQGPADLWTGPFGVAEPTDALIESAPGAGWTFAGGTGEGTTWAVKDEYAAMAFDQVAMRIGSRLQSREVTVKTSLAEPTLDNLVVALNGGTNTETPGPPTTHNYVPVDDNAATVPTYRAVLIDGWAPSGKRRRLIVRKVLNVDGIEAAYKRDGQFYFPVNFMGHWVSSAIPAFDVVDKDAI